MSKRKAIKIVIDNKTLDRYNEYYFTNRPRARVVPIKQPYHPSINQWMIMKRPAMNALKQKWKDFIVWVIEDEGLKDLKVDRCTMTFHVFYGTRRRHDVDNTVPKFILDGLCEAGLIVDDSDKNVCEITLRTGYDKDNPRTEIYIYEF